MLDNIINQNTEKLLKSLVSGEFHIGIEPIKEYVRFYIIADYIQKIKENEGISIYKYVEHNSAPTEEVKEDDTNQTVRIENEKWRIYERKIDHYNTLNFEKKVELLERQKQEALYKAAQKGDNKRKGNPKRYNGNEIKRFQLNEYKVLDDIKEGKYDRFGTNKTYKRINSEKGYLNKMNFREFKDFIDILTKEIEESDYEYKNIRYYKLEKRLNFELTKSVLKIIHDCKEEYGEKVSIVIDDMIPLFSIPLIKERQIYANLYSELDFFEKMIWRQEIDGITRFIKYLIGSCLFELKDMDIKNILEPELEDFKNIYSDLSFKNQYILRKDFSADDFKDLMKRIDEKNLKVQSQVNDLFSK